MQSKSQNKKGIYLAGEWLDTADTIENISPSDTSDCIGLFCQAEASHIEKAIESASKAQQQWEATGLEQRYAVLMAIGEELKSRAPELGELLSREEGKPLAEGTGEVFRAGQFFTYYAAAVLNQMGESADSVRSDIDINVSREAVGVVAIISPWNFPMATAAWKIAPALAFGNAVIWKPASLVPASAVALVEIIAKQSIPAGLCNLLVGSGGTIGQALVDHPDIAAVSFTGSVAKGRQIAASCAQNFTRIQLEMGSKNSLVIADDADMDTAVNCALNGAFGGTGQKCTASSRLIVDSKVHDEFVEKMVKGAQKMLVDHALKKGTQIGPVASKQQLEQNLANVALAQKEGGTLLCGGEEVKRDTVGYYMSPALIADTQNSWQVNQEELFAPIACVIKVDDYQQAVATANETRFGLTGGIITRSLARATDFTKRLKAGCVMVNLATAGTDYHVPFGGRGESSYGPREQGTYARDFYTCVKTAYKHSGTP